MGCRNKTSPKINTYKIGCELIMMGVHGVYLLFREARVLMGTSKAYDEG